MGGVTMRTILVLIAMSGCPSLFEIYTITLL